MAKIKEDPNIKILLLARENHLRKIKWIDKQIRHMIWRNIVGKK